MRRALSEAREDAPVRRQPRSATSSDTTLCGRTPPPSMYPRSGSAAPDRSRIRGRRPPPTAHAHMYSGAGRSSRTGGGRGGGWPVAPCMFRSARTLPRSAACGRACPGRGQERRWAATTMGPGAAAGGQTRPSMAKRNGGEQGVARTPGAGGQRPPWSGHQVSPRAIGSCIRRAWAKTFGPILGSGRAQADKKELRVSVGLTRTRPGPTYDQA